MRRQADSNRRTRFCRPLPSHSAMSPCKASRSTPDRNRTCNLLLRRQLLYPIELRALNSNMSIKIHSESPQNVLSVGETGFEPATLRSQSECATGLRHSPNFRNWKGHKYKAFYNPLPVLNYIFFLESKKSSSTC